MELFELNYSRLYSIGPNIVKKMSNWADILHEHMESLQVLLKQCSAAVIFELFELNYSEMYYIVPDLLVLK